MEYKKFGDLSRDEKLELMAAWLDGESIEVRDRSGSWGRSLHPSWMERGIYRIATRPVVKPSINWDHVAESYMALAADSNCVWYLYEEQPIPDVESGRFSSNKAYGKADHFASFDPGSFVQGPSCDIENWQNSLVFRPGHEPKGE